MTSKKEFKLAVLSIDGGGIKGIIPAMILAEIERRTDKPIHKLFNLIAGTSTGGILSLGLTKPNEERTGAKWTAEELVKLYTNEGKRIFKKNEETKIPFLLSQGLKYLFGTYLSDKTKITLEELFSNKYTRKEKIEVIKERLGEKTPISEALIEVVITSYAINKRMPFLFTSNPKKDNLPSNNFYEFCSGCTMYDAAMATSAAPTFFKAYPKSFISRSNGEYMLIDGGVIANNPTSIAIIEAMKTYEINNNGHKISLDEILVVSLGTGTATRQFFDETDKWGLIKWAKPLLNIVFSGQTEVIDYQMEYLLSDEQYHRFQLYYKDKNDGAKRRNSSYEVTEQIDVNDDMDDVSPENIENLKKAADKFIQEAGSDLTNLCDALLEALNTRERLNKI